MKIELNSPAASQLSPNRAAKQDSNSGVASTEGATEDRTTLHSGSASLQALTTQALNSPEVRQDKVDTFSQSVKSGEYQIDPTKIAAAILESEGS